MSILDGTDALFIGGNWVPAQSSSRLEVISPVSERVIATVPRGSAADVDAAVAAARRAFDAGPWPRMTVAERVEGVGRLRAVFESRKEEMAQAITAEMGSPITQSCTIQTTVPLMMLDEQRQIATESYPWSELRRSASGNALVTRTPKGVAALITPWNAPMITIIHKLGPALLAGCTVVLKPASLAPLSAYLLAEMVEEAGLPEGVVNVITVDRGEAEYLALHPGVDKVTFTGSTSAGRHLAAKCGELLRPITLELGGKSAGIVLDDADIPETVEALKLLSFRNSGQICTLKTRVLVSKAREREFVEALAEMVGSLPVGDPMDPNTHVGPMASQKQRDSVESYIEAGINDGARAVIGGVGRPKGLDKGWFVQPTLFAEVEPNSRIAQEEIFGPVLSVLSYEDEDEAVEIANNSVYGLSGAVFSEDIGHAVSIANRVKTGVLEVNGAPFGFHAPFGGVKQSGIGRESGWEGFEPYVEAKSIGLPKHYADSLERA
ncbi:Geranial dehydrogenase [Marinovum algicola]|uniref:Betaine-aldehyde dehydrogenase n=1 Tax=Marinovum algicola TaxID=42444 RepID=A0A975WEY2_9RHOB|nr:aldehyde dehydrogenase [Marinovum algicola]SEK09031.1 betaine-aldehyde dehydrogenase [Marinovum algicola]SLN71782.1 Geranial dehydrogenase [Marinovum algicola]